VTGYELERGTVLEEDVLILVWERRDDPNLLRHAQRAKEVGRNPRVVVYETEFGPSASYYAWEAAGRPVHAVKQL
jgi:hypothetical protein